MTDNTELKRLAEGAVHAGDHWGLRDSFERQLAKLVSPETVLALIADLDEARNGMKYSCAIRLKKEIERLESEAVYSAAGFDAAREEIARLKAENKRITEDASSRALRSLRGDCQDLMVEREELKAEIAGLRTGYEAYEQVNAELKAENERLRDDLEQIQYDANAWRNGEESVWIEVFNSEGDDPFICAISGQITVEQLALIQTEILEYREDYFEKGSGLYVFRCAHYQAHYDNVGMTEPAHWETDFESFSPFPWEEEAAALGQGEQS